MQVKGISKTIFLLILALHLITAGSAAAAVISVNNSTDQVENFTSIQAAVDASNPGDKIVVKPGIYEENIVINKNVSIISESGNFSDTIVQAADSSQDVFSIWANGVSIKGFGINGPASTGIHLFGVIDCNIENNKLFNNSCGIDLYMMSSGNKLYNNEISDCLTGISLGDSLYNNLSNNLISNCSNGISLFDSPNNSLESNIIFNNSEGVSLTGESNDNTLINNTITLDEFGLHIYEASNNRIYNNYFNNTENVKFETNFDKNIWNTTKTEGINIAGGPYIGGNLWAKPDGTIYPSGVKDVDLDGILDSQYDIEDSQFIDYLPLTKLKPATLTVNNSTGQVANFTSIQAAIDNAHPGDTVLIFPGVYEENVDVYVTNLTLISQSIHRGDTVIKAANPLDDVFYIIADGVTIRGLEIAGPVDYPTVGIRLNGVKYCKIENNQLFNNYSNSIQNISSGNSSVNLNNLSSNSGIGIRLDSSSYNILSNNTLSENVISILLHNSTKNTLTNNSAFGNNYGIWMNSSSNNTLNENNMSSNKVGAYLKISRGNILDNNTVLSNTGSGINLWNSFGNTLSNSTASKNSVSIILRNSSKNTLFNNKVSGSSYGMWVSFSSNNNLSDNNASNNKFGLYLKNSNDNKLLGNQANSNSRNGIYLGFSSGNILNSNRIISNKEYGLFLLNSTNSSIYNNYFNNTNNIYLEGSNADTSLNTTLKQTKNILDGPYLGGNFWATPKEDGFSQIHEDKNGDGLCDVAYVVNEESIDYLPLTDSRIAN